MNYELHHYGDKIELIDESGEVVEEFISSEYTQMDVDKAILVDNGFDDKEAEAMSYAINSDIKILDKSRK